MINKFIEQQKVRARQYHRQKCDNFSDGIISYHLYDQMKPDTLTFWDDAVFIVNDYRVSLSWTHPRLQYKELIEEEARNRTENQRPDVDLFANAIPNYKRVGRSRKKIVSSTCVSDDRMKAYYDLLRTTENVVEREVPFIVAPFMKIKWYDWAKGMELCLPFEVRSVGDLKTLTEIARSLVMRKATLHELCGASVYTQTDWLRDSKIMQADQQNPLFSHAVA
ncbi:MAG: hypothetical protein Q7K13_08325 [Polynucleobacter sp.]|uniref:hypothetical protein n=1 Tax=Polynucleobacter sp. TaxID=2029855 RepID=UPI002721171C|nr:hypothetical protein [Polynucleobacter sp.]MDO8714467.1 hypothetical protein [Polynucleobacter sp.]